MSTIERDRSPDEYNYPGGSQDENELEPRRLAIHTRFTEESRARRIELIPNPYIQNPTDYLGKQF
jgi:hypothetical protein